MIKSWRSRIFSLIGARVLGRQGLIHARSIGEENKRVVGNQMVVTGNLDSGQRGHSKRK